MNTAPMAQATPVLTSMTTQLFTVALAAVAPPRQASDQADDGEGQEAHNGNNALRVSGNHATHLGPKLALPEGLEPESGDSCLAASASWLDTRRSDAELREHKILGWPSMGTSLILGDSIGRNADVPAKSLYCEISTDVPAQFFLSLQAHFKTGKSIRRSLGTTAITAPRVTPSKSLSVS